MNQPSVSTLGELKKSGYRPKAIKDELRDNLIAALKSGQPLFTGIQGYEETVIPQLQAAILSKHNILFLGLRGQAKTRLSRLMTELLDEWVPVIEGSELNDDPLQPLSRYGIDMISQLGDATPVAWLHRSARYTEKLATPDVSVADLIGDLDPIKAASARLSYADERVIHYGLIPRSHRCLFVINELPDLQARIQVALFNILQEGDIQIRGFKLRLPLDIGFVFTANPEDYTNRGSIVTPLKDRIGSQILTHYPSTVETSAAITQQEATLSDDQRKAVTVPPLLARLVELIAFEARKSEYIDQKSGVSARLTISAMESLYSVAQRRMLLNGETQTTARIADLYGIVPAITGKVELVYEGELEGIASVAMNLIGKAIRSEFLRHFPDPAKARKSKAPNPYAAIVEWFGEGNETDLTPDASQKVYEQSLLFVNGLSDFVKKHGKEKDKDVFLLLMEFVLHGLAEFSQISKKRLEKGMKFSDLVGSIFNMQAGEEEG
jgi:magnesium chelatase subunit I